MKRWHMTTFVRLGFRDRVRVLIGVPIFFRFTTPDQACSAAGELSASVRRTWPADAETLELHATRGWPPLAWPLPPPPKAPPR